MQAIIEALKDSSPAVQALGVSVGGIIGVFTTLAAFFLLIWGGTRIGRR
ncbi:MAG: hypothetical protein KKA67_11880 [Spirochaetes bacterium]|nr:hypothetical protein [Spirochaetota bacterium]MBU1081431.1 hypothetical protein [Spirochaetota bacterium]